MLSPHSLLFSQALFPIPTSVLDTNATENHNNDKKDRFVKFFQNTEFREEVTMIRERMAIQDKKLK